MRPATRAFTGTLSTDVVQAKPTNIYGYENVNAKAQ